MHLASEDGKALQSFDLSALDLRIPVGALDKPDHQPPTRAACEIDEPVDDEGAALLIGLDHKADPVPAGKLGIEAERLQQIERELEPVGLLGINVQADVILSRQSNEPFHARQKLGHHTVTLRARIARMQRRKLYRDAGPFVN